MSAGISLQACDFYGFFRNSGFLKFLCQKFHFCDSRKNKKIGDDGGVNEVIREEVKHKY